MGLGESGVRAREMGVIYKLQAWGPEFDPEHHTKPHTTAVIPTPGSQTPTYTHDNSPFKSHLKARHGGTHL